MAEVRRQTAEFIAALPRDKDGRTVLVEGGEDSYQHITPDEDVDKNTGAIRPTEYNKEFVRIKEDGSLTVSAILHRPRGCDVGRKHLA